LAQAILALGARLGNRLLVPYSFHGARSSVAEVKLPRRRGQIAENMLCPSALLFGFDPESSTIHGKFPSANGLFPGLQEQRVVVPTSQDLMNMSEEQRRLEIGGIAQCTQTRSPGCLLLGALPANGIPLAPATSPKFPPRLPDVSACLVPFGLPPGLPPPLPPGTTELRPRSLVRAPHIPTCSKTSIDAPVISESPPAAQDELEEEDVDDDWSHRSVEQAVASSGAIDGSCSDLQYSDLPSIGSAKHFDGNCDRCCFHPKGRCLNGLKCHHCHFDHEKRKRKNKKKTTWTKNPQDLTVEDASDTLSVSDASSLPVSPTRPFGPGGIMQPVEQSVSAAPAVTPGQPPQDSCLSPTNFLTAQQCQEFEYQRAREEYAHQLKEENRYLRACLAQYAGSEAIVGPNCSFQGAEGTSGLVSVEGGEVTANQPLTFGVQASLPWPQPSGLQAPFLLGNVLQGPWSSMPPNGMWWPQSEGWQGGTHLDGCQASATQLGSSCTEPATQDQFAMAAPPGSTCQEPGIGFNATAATVPCSFPACGGS